MAVKANKLALLAVLMVLVLAPAAAFAALAKFGPINTYMLAPGTTGTGNGYPKYYMDQNGVAVDMPVPPLPPLTPRSRPDPSLFGFNEARHAHNFAIFREAGLDHRRTPSGR